MTEIREIDIPIDESKTKYQSNPYKKGWAVYIVEDAQYYPPNTDDQGHRYVVNLRSPVALEDTDENGNIVECRKDIKLTYWMDKKVEVMVNQQPVFENGKPVVRIEANDNARGCVRKIGRIRYGDKLMKPPMPDGIIGVILMANLIPQKSKPQYVNCYEFTPAPADWFVWHAGTGGAVDQYAQIEGQPAPTKFNADGTYSTDG